MTSEPAQGLQDEMSRWRVRAADTLIAASLITNLPLLTGAVASDGLRPSPALQALYLATYLALVALLAARKVDAGTRGGLLVVLGYVLAVVGMMRLGLVGAGRLNLIILPFVAQAIVHPVAGRVAAGLSLSIHLGFAWLAARGVLSRWLVIPENSVDGTLWLLQLGGMVMLLVPTLLLLERFLLLHRSTLAAERLASLRSDAMYRELTLVVAERASLEREVLDLVERERRLLGRDLHDGLCQELTGARLRLEVLEQTNPACLAADQAQLRAVRELVESALGQAYALARGLGTSADPVDGLADRLRDLARTVDRELKVPCTFEESGAGTDPSASETGQLLRIAREAVANALKHACAQQLQIRLVHGPRDLELSIEDDGVGLPQAPPPGGLGLRIMRHRAQAIGAALLLGPRPGGGTRVACRLVRSAQTDPTPASPPNE